MELANYDMAKFTYALMPDGRKEWHDIRGGHFGLLHHPGDVFDEASGVQGDFLRRHFFAA